MTKRKVLTNYRFMLESAGVLVNGRLQPFDFRGHWFGEAVQLFWDRRIFDGALPHSERVNAFEDAFEDAEIYKLLGCDEAQGRAFVRAAFREYARSRMARRFDQVRTLWEKGLIAA